jgi:hypothetical protein
MRLNRRRKAIVVAIFLVVAEALVLRRRQGTLIGTHTIVRCRDGHLFNTIWIPGASIKSIRLGLWRVQRCPVGPHWSVVTPVQLDALDDAERELALSRPDVRLP